MSFPPDSKRVLYNINPLEQVVCQVRFPPILRITSEEPVRFQELIRDKFPLLEEQNAGIDLPDEFSRQLPAELLRMLPTAGTEKKSYSFSSLDGRWVVGLAREFVGLSTPNYGRWEEFKEHFTIGFEALRAVYRPAAFTRVGLRYRDVIDRNRLQLDDAPWTDLLRAEIAGLFAAEGIEEERIESVMQTVILRLSDCDGRVRMRHGLAKTDDTGKLHYVIDSDFYAEGLEEDSDVTPLLDCFNRMAGRLFRWCISDRLHESMEPQGIG